MLKGINLLLVANWNIHYVSGQCRLLMIGQGDRFVLDILLQNQLQDKLQRWEDERGQTFRTTGGGEPGDTWVECEDTSLLPCENTAVKCCWCSHQTSQDVKETNRQTAEDWSLELLYVPVSLPVCQCGCWTVFVNYRQTDRQTDRQSVCAPAQLTAEHLHQHSRRLTDTVWLLTVIWVREVCVLIVCLNWRDESGESRTRGGGGNDYEWEDPWETNDDVSVWRGCTRTHTDTHRHTQTHTALMPFKGLHQTLISSIWNSDPRTEVHRHARRLMCVPVKRLRLGCYAS